MNNKWCANLDSKTANDGANWIKAVRRVIRMGSENAAFVYTVIEGYEGILTHSTLPFESGSRFRDIELLISPSFQAEADEMIQSLGQIAVELS